MSSDVQIDVGDPAFFGILAVVVLLLMIPRLAPRWIAGRGAAISPIDLRRRLDGREAIVIVDVRTPGEYYGEDGRIGRSVLLPLDRLNTTLGDPDALPSDYRDKTIVVVCRTGSRASFAVRRLRRCGYHALLLNGGINAWRSEGFPVQC